MIVRSFFVCWRDMKKGTCVVFCGALSAICGLAFSLSALTPRALAASLPSPGPDRFTTILVEYTEYEWWIAAWANNETVCQVTIDHEGMPTPGEVYTDCDEDVYDDWKDQQPCPPGTLARDSSSCPGYYVYFISSAPAEREVTVTLPPPMVWAALEDCVAVSALATNVCESIPLLVLIGEEPLPNESILRIEGTLDGASFTCGSVCKLNLEHTDENGSTLEFWAYSSYGDSSERFTAQVRVAEVTDNNPDEQSWYVDVLSAQWIGAPAASCSETWGAFPPVGGPPPWLATPKDGGGLNSNVPYAYLAGSLIGQGVVDASNCPDDGLLPGGGANACGQEAARPMVAEWQNRFDGLILQIAQDTEVPAQLLKNLFSRESQFWPGIYKDTDEVGLGQLTEDGADAALLWNPSFYEQFCPWVLEDKTCRKGYLHLKAEEQDELRGALVRSVDAYCLRCPLGLDLTRADFSVSVFAETLLANCEQTGRIVRNVTGKTPGEAASYENLWRFTLVNYNAGPGCLSKAVQDAWNANKVLDWENVSAKLEPACQVAIDYVKDISR